MVKNETEKTSRDFLWADAGGPVGPETASPKAVCKPFKKVLKFIAVLVAGLLVFLVFVHGPVCPAEQLVDGAG